MSKNKNFPEKPISILEFKSYIRKVEIELKKEQQFRGLDTLMGDPSSEAIYSWRKLLPYNPNNLGNWSIKEIKPDHKTAFVEQELIRQMIDLYHGDKDQIEGYVTIGGSEANLFSTWLGRKFLEKKGIKKEKIILIKTSLTHYSLEKTADVIGVRTFLTPLSEETWGMDLESFRKSIRKLMKQGYKGFLVPLTLGYSLTGTFDPFESICALTRILKKEFKDINFFLWLDAAINGLIEPFINKNFRPFIHPEIQTFITDFHKFGFTPIPSGIILYKKELRKLIEKPIDYLSEKDNTLLGSRSGVAPVACWAVVNHLGKLGFRKMILRSMKKKEVFIEEMKQINGLKIITSKNSLNCGVVKENSIINVKEIENNYGLCFRPIRLLFNKNRKSEKLMAKAFFN
jgi:glutamate/tyrosine decarboxylase-like PLP-dependent enzyme